MPTFRRPSRRGLVAAVALALVAGRAGLAADVPAPAEVLGFEPGADSELAPWADVVDYFRAVADASDRVAVETLGTTTLGRPFVAAVVSAPETIADLDRYKGLQHRLADPTYRPAATDEEAASLVAESKPAVLVTCSIHSSETASTLMACELLHELATGDDPETLAILDGTILLLVPSVNPDGVDLVRDWYVRSKGTPWEGSGMPRLYHHYAGHDTNRDWFMLNLDETRLLTHYLYAEWFPTITWDVHQMGPGGPRLFVPPFHDPINPNLDPRLNQGIFLVGAHLAADLARAGKQGVATHVMYDNWWNGGNRTVPQRHNMVGILTEAASVKLATPIFLEKRDLRGGGRGFDDHAPSVTFVDPWPGGWWRLRDIVDYELICARSLLTLAARYGDWFQSNYRAMALDQVAAGADEPPFAWVVPADQRDPGTAAKMIEILHRAGIEIDRAAEDFEAGGVSYPAGSWILPAAQPFRPHLKDMMERQRYPDRLGPDGRPERPYDVAGWTLPLQMGVKAATIAEPFDYEGEPVEAVDLGGGRIEGDAGPDGVYVLTMRSNDDYAAVNALHEKGLTLRRLVGEQVLDDGRTLPAGAVLVPGAAERAIGEILPEVSSVARAWREDEIDARPLPPRRIAVYQPWEPSMDEGWTRLVLERFGYAYETFHNADIIAGDLIERIDVLLVPSIGAGTLRDGYGPDETEPAYVGGLAGEGVDAIRRFVEDGGTLVCLEDSCGFFMDALELPVQDALEDLSSDRFYCPGSIVSVRFDNPDGWDLDHGGYLLAGMPAEGSAYFAGSLAFTTESGKGGRVLARYADAGLLQSGWLLGAEHLEGKAAVVEATVGDGRVILFGFPPQHRGQTHGTFPLLFNALLGPGDAEEDGGE